MSPNAPRKKMPLPVALFLNLENGEVTVDTIVTRGRESGALASYYPELDTDSLRSAKQAVRNYLSRRELTPVREITAANKRPQFLYDASVLRRHAEERAAAFRDRETTPDPRDQRFGWLISATVSAVLTALVFSLAFSAERNQVRERLESSRRRGDIDALRALERETRRLEPVLNDELADPEQRRMEALYGLAVPVPEVVTTHSPYRAEIAAAIAEHTKPIPIEPERLLAVLPYLDQPTWLFVVADTAVPVQIGSRIEAEGNRGHVVEVGQNYLFYQSEGALLFLERPRLKLCNTIPEQPGDQSFLYSVAGGNLALLARFFGLPEQEGSIAGFFPPWSSIDELADLVAWTSGEPIPLTVGLYRFPLTMIAPPDEILELLFTELHIPTRVQIDDNLDLWYRGQSASDIARYLDLTVQKKNGTLVIWR